MIKKIINNYKNIDKIAIKILKKGLMFCFALCIASVLILLTYEVFNKSPNTYYIGIGIFKLSLTFAVEFIICALSVDLIKKETL